MNEFYAEEDAQQILRLALHKDSQSGALSRGDLVAAAAEMGVSEDALLAAERQWLTEGAKKRDMQLFAAERRREFFSELTTYLLVNAMLVGINLFLTPGFFWAIFPILGWGVAIGMQAFETFTPQGENFRREFEKWQRKREKRAKAAAQE